METVTLNEKGQVTIPARIRKARGLRKGMRLAIVEIRDRIELVVNEVPTSILHRAAELKKRYFRDLSGRSSPSTTPCILPWPKSTASSSSNRTQISAT